ncbi:DMT family transporter [Pokkaliibacter sp. CJK22405]|uniref:DMT family transporter n=1 Tax=Pokkaliibacter sp. CJK22405 TaxID=3384615 RepID=UPI003984FBD3
MANTAYLAAAFLSLVWGCNFLFMKWASEVISATQIVELRVLFGFVPILLFALYRKELKLAHVRYFGHFIVMALLATALYYVAFAAAASRLPSGVAGMLSGSIPLFACLASFLMVRDEPITKRMVQGLIIAFAGILVIASPWSNDQGLDATGIVLMLLGSASLGLSFAYARRFIAPLKLPASALATYQMGLALLMLSFVTPEAGMTLLMNDHIALFSVVIGLGIMGTGVAFLLYYIIVSQLGAIKASTVTYIAPVIALIVGWSFAGEALGVKELLAVMAILGGVYLTQSRVIKAKT